MLSINDYSQSLPAINATYFPNTPFSSDPTYYWTSTIYKNVPNPNVGFGIPDNTKAFVISSREGKVNTLDDMTLDPGTNFPIGNNSAYVRCVAGP
ncbi:MAG: DUF1566 domain-containing protein [Leptospiraceae bacterium]|nr:DUF1566 domain-containing protein [Leptospiraceae bacterium]